MRDMIYAAVFAVVCTGLAFAADQRIDQRVETAINTFQEKEIERQLQFFIMKKEFSGLTGEDRINQEILKQQLEMLRAK